RIWERSKKKLTSLPFGLNCSWTPASGKPTKPNLYQESPANWSRFRLHPSGLRDEPPRACPEGRPPRRLRTPHSALRTKVRFLAPMAFWFAAAIPVVILFYLPKRKRVVRLG